MIEILLSSLLVMLASLAGVVAVWNRAGSFIERNLDYLLSFSAGVFLVIAYQLSGETIEHSESIAYGFAWIFTGALLIWVLFKMLPALHHHHGGDHTVHTIDPRKLILTDGLHNIGDGILLAASFAVSPLLGATAAVSVFVHEVLQEMAEFFVFRQAGYSVQKALTINFLVSSTVLIGAVGGYFLLDTFEVLEGPLLGLSAGAFLIVVLNDLIPHSLRDSISKAHFVKHLAWFAIGLLVMGTLSAALPHEEVHIAELAAPIEVYH